MIISLLSLLAAPSVAYRIQTVTKNFWQDEEIKVKLWTWNSGKADLTREAKRLAESSADVIVTCQTEATKDIHQFMPEEWILVAHGEHWGAAGGSINAQMSSVFVRRLDGSQLEGNASEIIGRKPWRSDYGTLGAFRSSSGKEEFTALTQVTATDYKGKGGVSTTLHFPATKASPVRLQFVCAHLDSESDEARHFGIGSLLSEARAESLEVGTMLRKAVVGKSGVMRSPCALYDRMFVKCNTDSLDLPAPADVVFLFGDLNFRLSAENIRNISQAYLLDFFSRESFAKNDRLSKLDPFLPHAPEQQKIQDVLVKDWHEGGFGFQCNDPFELYPPTYKRKGGQMQLERVIPWSMKWEEEAESALRPLYRFGLQIYNSTGDLMEGATLESVKNTHGISAEFPLTIKSFPLEACSTLGTAMETCGGRMQPACEDWVLQLAEHCYVRKDKKGLHQWARKKGDLQLGWLDRFCWRRSKMGSQVGTRLSTQDGWVDYAGKEDKENGSDHMPVSATFRLTSVRCSCFSLLPDNVFIPHCKDEDGRIKYQEILLGDTVSVQCQPGFQMRNRRSENSALLICAKDGTLQPVSFEKTDCLQVCTMGELLWPGLRSQGPGPILDGDTFSVVCANRSDLLLGVPTMTCGPYGSISPIDFSQSPACASVCEIPKQEDVVLVTKTLAAEGLGRFSKDYGDEIKQWASRHPMHLLTGGSVRYACRNDCLTFGETERRCGPGGSLAPSGRVPCGCTVRLRVKEVSFDDPTLAGLVDKVKFQGYRGPLQKEKLEELREHKGYEAATKFTLEDLKSNEANDKLEISVDKPATVELHFTLCSNDHSIGKRRHILAFWTCGVLATSHSSGFTLQDLLGNVYDYDGEKTLQMPLDMKVKRKDARMKVTFEYHMTR